VCVAPGGAAEAIAAEAAPTANTDPATSLWERLQARCHQAPIDTIAAEASHSRKPGSRLKPQAGIAAEAAGRDRG